MFCLRVALHCPYIRNPLLLGAKPVQSAPWSAGPGCGGQAQYHECQHV